MTKLRIGHGFDVHPFVGGRPLVIGGVQIPFGQGLAGHSDADVLLHAVCDALLGAMGLPDIGQHFPPTDPRYKGADSKGLLADVVKLTRSNGMRAVVNVDAVIMAEAPPMNPHIPAMKKIIAALLEIPESCVGIKATTCERMGFVGRQEGIAASAVCLVEMYD
ncbi:MAG: 2-C-methyl-D-erythritol 2,4-cyclodiphosphate synthase [Candidatus Zixiibacteriota bacterium]